MKTGKKNLKKIILIAVCALIVLVIAGLWVLSVYIYNDNFNKRFESYGPLKLYIEDFSGLQRTRYQFPSDKGQTLTGYLYSYGEEQKGIIVMAHGFGGGGHNSYMDCADEFARHGYLVFAYDATGCDESEGKGIGGFPQGVIDLNYAVSFVEESGNFPDLPIVLFGHSWGAYSVSSVLSLHPEVRAVIACSGFNSSPEMFEAEGRNQAGDAIALFMPFVNLHELIRYGKYASSSAMNGFAASDAAVMIVHSEDDDVVPVSIGYNKYYAKYSDDPRFTFIHLEHSGHNYVYNDRTYIDAFNEEFNRWRDSLDYDYKDKEFRDRFAAERAGYISSHLDREQWSHMLDPELFGEFIRFFDEHL